MSELVYCEGCGVSIDEYYLWKNTADINRPEKIQCESCPAPMGYNRFILKDVNEDYDPDEALRWDLVWYPDLDHSQIVNYNRNRIPNEEYENMENMEDIDIEPQPIQPLRSHILPIRPPHDVTDDIPEEQKQTKPGHCIICYDRMVSAIFIPCNHISCCTVCATHIIQNGGAKCPVCRTPNIACDQVFFT